MYFSKFPFVEYSLPFGDENKTVFVRNLLRRISLSEEIKDGRGAFLEYDIRDGERPEHIADRVYGDPRYHWLVLLTSNIVDPYHGWCKSYSVLQDYINQKYFGYSVYITSGSTGSFFYSTSVGQGNSLHQEGISAEVLNYEPEFCRLTVPISGSFVTGTAYINNSIGATYEVFIHRVDRQDLAVHHFQLSRPVGSCGAVESVIVDPLSKQTNSYSYLRGHLGGDKDPYPIVDSGGLCYGVPNETVQLYETYIGEYMGISGDSVNIYSLSNTVYETEQNELKRTIRVLNPRYKSQAEEELKSLLES